MALTLLEQVTIITFNNAEEEAEIYTFNQKLINRFSKFADEHPELCKHTEPKTEMHAHVFTLNKGLLSIHPKRVLTDEQRETLRQKALASGVAPHATRQKQKGE